MLDRTTASWHPGLTPSLHNDSEDEREASSNDDESDECLPGAQEPPAGPHIMAVAPTAASGDARLRVDVSALGSDRPPSGQDSTIMTARAYQLEMLAESMKRNVIVAVCC